MLLNYYSYIHIVTSGVHRLTTLWQLFTARVSNSQQDQICEPLKGDQRGKVQHSAAEMLFHVSIIFNMSHVSICFQWNVEAKSCWESQVARDQCSSLFSAMDDPSSAALESASDVLVSDGRWVLAISRALTSISRSSFLNLCRIRSRKRELHE